MFLALPESETAEFIPEESEEKEKAVLQGQPFCMLFIFSSDVLCSSWCPFSL